MVEEFNLERGQFPPTRRGKRRMAKEILIADSDKGDQEELQKIFQTPEYHLIFSETGEEALLRTKLFKPDVIIASGSNLREMGGLEVVRNPERGFGVKTYSIHSHLKHVR